VRRAMAMLDPNPDLEVLLPSICVVGGRRYRNNNVPGAGQEMRFNDSNGESEIVDFELQDGVTETETGFRCQVAVPALFYGKLIGKGGESRKRLEQSTSTRITIPARGKNGDVVIDGKVQGAVISCRTRIEMLVDNAQKSSPMTHFISIPLLGAEFDDSMDRFRETCMDIQRRDNLRLSKEMFALPETLHLTCGALKLYGQDNIKQAKALLRECGKNVKQMLAGAAGTSIIVQGVEMMNDDPHNMDVLYASAFFGREKGGLLQEIADHLQTAFANAGFLEPEHDHVKLHATLINSKKRQSSGGPGKREAFDGKLLLDKFRTFNFGSAPLKHLHLSKMARRQQGGYYEAEEIVTLL